MPQASSLKPSTSRKGAAAMIAVVLIAVLGVFSTILIKNLLRDQLQNRRNVVQEQTKRLIYDFRDRTELILQNGSDDFNGETLKIPPQADPFRGTYHLTSKVDKTEKTIHISAVYEDESGKTIITNEENFEFGN